ncbi:MAG: Zn-dependent alcohol dehydrogenase [Spirochaetaceae bacterium]|nr:Zn-dependent alcohol dehydrogenase [Spirochaetaceae bacterium]HPG26987.1 Zn-dependent alcohol dehydrogenase [Myxococcota bacterium]
MQGIVFDGQTLALIDDLEVRDPGPGEVEIEIRASGVCHSDLSVVNGTIPYPTPVVLGHEGAGVVRRCGEGVATLAPGDPVALSTLGQCGACPACDSGRPTMCRETFGKRPTPFRARGMPHHNFANLSTFAERIVVKANQAIRIPPEVPFASAALIGCGVLTGTGAVFHRAKVGPGDSVVVIGAGGIGLNVVQAARLAGAHPILVLDTNREKQALARQLGATGFVDPREHEDVVAAVKARLGGWGARHVFECVGAKTLMEQAIQMVDWGGNAVMLGVPSSETRVEFLPAATFLDVTIMGCRYGSSQPQADVARICELYLAGRLELDALVSARYPLADWPRLVEDMKAGRIARGVLEMPGGR